MAAPSTWQVVEDLQAAGLVLTLTPDRALSVAPACDLTPALRDTIRAHKVELVAWLAAANDSTVEAVGAVATVATVAVANPPGSEAAPAEAIGTVPVSADADRWCWPHSSAMNTAEINRFTGRVALFVAKGMTSTDADALADKLVTRDRDGDDRRVCLECANLSGWNGRRQCRGLHHAGMGGPLVSAGQVATLQRCDGFKGGGIEKKSVNIKGGGTS